VADQLDREFGFVVNSVAGHHLLLLLLTRMRQNSVMTSCLADLGPQRRPVTDRDVLYCCCCCWCWCVWLASAANLSCEATVCVHVKL